MNNKKVVYVPIPGNTTYEYPIFMPIVVEEPEVYKATGRLSAGDYEKTKENLAGFPALIPLIAALAPLVPAAIKGVSKLLSKKPKNNRYALPPAQGGYYSTPTGGYIPTNPNIKTLKDIQNLYDEYE